MRLRSDAAGLKLLFEPVLGQSPSVRNPGSISSTRRPFRRIEPLRIRMRRPSTVQADAAVVHFENFFFRIDDEVIPNLAGRKSSQVHPSA
jgi:hypothetical protein